MRKRHFISMNGDNASNRNIWWNDNIKVNKCNKDRDNIMIITIKVITLLIVVN